MNRDKQIEEIAKILGDVEDRRCHHISCFDCPYGEESDNYCTEKVQASYLIEEGYRKASEVAREVLALIWDAFQSTHYDAEFEERFAKIEKKYTEGEG